MQRLADQLLGVVRAVGVGSVDEVDAELDRAAQHANAFVVVVRRAPYALPGYSHGAETESIDGEITTQGEGSGCLVGG